ncbi:MULTISPECIES: MBL fold metallo-hydrolase [Geobacillus]|uniref:Hydroxyacylglutathione hydrolase n=1 Tax=Geobacillus icigianus TaxID=1430331 RepID=A0ABU6BKI9_9BACL|nr:MULTISPECIES: MBL fold metallo-hydrolase [Geobacillus]KYD25116.1 Zinc metallohydrolase, metallo-beta-lactamase family [Geobacillus sp. B4113_201601]MEB3752280.1 Hydroxyacylglutathione hydrolase [Geobacillus icigianus]NNV05654.1 MBL fold metallo-hydrolase [Geobacillus sp. MMMUD3]TWG31094.1 glyoxylase-like metal-dependent hydrolase (beta-lactamase superfamily II) [Geobacillus sp. C56-T2]
MNEERVHRITVPTPFPVGDVHMYVIAGDRLTLVDAGVKTEEAWQRFVHRLAEIGYRPEEIEQIVITHHHPDHVGLLDYFPHAPIIGHPKADPFLRRERAFMERYVRFFEGFFTECGVDRRLFSRLSKEGGSLRYASRRAVDIAVTDGDAVPGLPRWRVIETPGHAQSHIVLYREEDGLLIGGDHLLVHISPNPMMEPPAEGETERPKPLLQYNESLEKMLNYDIVRSLNGHGDDATDIRSLVRERLTKQRQRAERVLDMVKERPQTVFDVCQKLFPSVYERQLMLTMSETIGQLDYLEANGYVTKKQEAGRYVYEAAGVSVCG